MNGDAKFTPKIVGMICNWCCYGGADLCGVSRFQYPPYIRLIRVMCSGRVDLKNVLLAFSKGADGMFIGGCHLDDCHYITHGNYDVLAMVNIAQRLLESMGINPRRLRLEWVSAGEGIRFANIMNEYGKEILEMGPLGKAEGLDPAQLELRLAAASNLAPYIRLVERERFRIPVKSESRYEGFYDSDEFKELFNDLVLEKFIASQITRVLSKGRQNAQAISEQLGLDSVAVLRNVKDLSRQGVVSYDPANLCYEMA